MYTVNIILCSSHFLVDVLNLVLYQDQVSARSRQKEKAFISLDSFSGLQLLNKLDKHYNIIIAITSNQVVRLSFETIEQRAEWVTHLQRHFGQGKVRPI